MPRPTSSTLDFRFIFWVGLNPNEDDDLETFETDVDFEYSTYTDDPAYDPHSGNSITMSWHPVTDVDLKEVCISFKCIREELEPLLKKHSLTGKRITLAFSYELDDYLVENGDTWTDTRATVEVDTSRLDDSTYVDGLIAEIEEGIFNYFEPLTEGVVDRSYG